MSFTIKLLAVVLLLSLIASHWYAVVNYADKMEATHAATVAVSHATEMELLEQKNELKAIRTFLRTHLDHHPGGW
jgi:lipopolysaccharide biosynthesis regulator YciM